MDISKRKAPRVPIQLEVEFDHQHTGILFLKTRDISDTGIFIKLPTDEYPPIGTKAKVKLKENFDNGEEPPILAMEVVRHSSSGIGLSFLL
ncbi:MAG: PilZ domain-containing protein [Gammaproteobacteria bacterium]|nr:PilZ domain-containing protein [Gammaproteobacteria bacterium]